MAAENADKGTMGNGAGNAGGNGGATGSGAAGGSAASGDGKGTGAEKPGAGGASGDGADGDDASGGDDDDGEWGAEGKAEKEKPKPGEKESEAGKGKTGEADAPYKLEVPEELSEFTSKEETEAFAAFAKKEGISLEHANKLAKYSAERSKAAIEASRTFMDTQSKSWLAEIKKDEKLGGENFKVTQANVRRGLAHIGDAKAINASAENMGVNYWPPLVKLANALGELLAPDQGSIQGGRGGNGSETRDQMLARIYGTG